MLWEEPVFTCGVHGVAAYSVGLISFLKVSSHKSLNACFIFPLKFVDFFPVLNYQGSNTDISAVTR